MKVVFLQRDSFVTLAVAQLSSVLTQQGHVRDLFIESGHKRFLASVLESGADLFAFSCTTGNEPWVIRTVKELKKESSTPVIVGGPHATFFPEIIEEPGIDYVCRGEGEVPLIELLEVMEADSAGTKNVPNIWSKDANGSVCKMDLRPFVEELDELPFPDFTIYNKYTYMVSYNRDMFPVITSRGCPFNCSYCFNRNYKELYKNKGKYLRRTSPERVLELLDCAKREYGIRKINFVDDSFFLFPSWVEKFTALYKEKIGLPFIINVEATQVTDDLVRALREAGCVCCRMGLESGNNYLRQDVLNKKVTTEQIKSAAASIKKHGIKLSTYNILGLPGETVENAIETFELNRKIKTDFIWCSLLQPYPGTAINEYVIENGYFKQDNSNTLDASYFVSTRIKLENEKEITNLQKLMQAFLQLHVPAFIFRRVIKLPWNPVFNLIFKLSFIYNKMKIQKIKLIPLVALGLRSLSYMREQEAKDS